MECWTAGNREIYAAETRRHRENKGYGCFTGNSLRLSASAVAFALGRLSVDFLDKTVTIFKESLKFITRSEIEC
jgi:hypothetical protein